MVYCLSRSKLKKVKIAYQEMFANKHYTFCAVFNLCCHWLTTSTSLSPYNKYLLIKKLFKFIFRVF